jgi:hypothetical protein
VTSIHTSTTMLLDSENVGVTVGIPLLCSILDSGKLYKLRYKTLHMYSRLLAAIFDLIVTSTSESFHGSPTVLLDADNVGVAV